MEKIKPDIIIHHAPCMDGVLSAFLVRKYWQQVSPEYQPELIGIKPGVELTNAILDQCNNKIVLMLDVLYNEENMRTLMESAVVYAIDHHRSNIKALNGLLTVTNAILDESKPACHLVFDWLYTNDMPSFVFHVGMRDMFDFTHPLTKPFSTGLFDMVVKQRKPLLDLYDQLWNDPTDLPLFTDIHTLGNTLQMRDDIVINHLVSIARKYKIIGRSGTEYIVYATPTHLLRSEVGNLLAERIEKENKDPNVSVFGVTYHYDITSGDWWVSMRSTKESLVDLSIISKDIQEDGGGHPKASGITWCSPLNELLHSI
jgi:hypothetical protein